MYVRQIRYNGRVQANQTEINSNGASFLISYNTPVVVDLISETEVNGTVYKPGVYKTDEFHSVTTSKHINRYTETSRTMPQADIDSLFARL